MRINIGNRARIIVYVSATMFFVLMLAVIFPIVDSSEDALATTGVSSEATTSLTISAGQDTSSVNVSVNSADGSFVASGAENSANFAVTTNNYTGYTLSIVSTDDLGKLADHAGNFIESISTNVSEADFSGANNTTYNNKWGFKPNKYVNNNTVVDNTGSNSVFLPSPTTTPTVLNTTTSANAADDDYTLALGIRANMLLPSGVYSKTLNLVALANAAPYTVSFNQNTADTVTNMPTSLGGSTSTTSISIPNTTPVRANYTFMGWCDRKDVINECPTGGHTFQPGGSYGIDQTDDNTSVTLYAMWQPDFYMQEVAMWGQDLAIGESVQAIDMRDNKVYWVTKEETDPANPRAEIDATTGKAYQIWMTQNLDFDLDANTALTPDTSDVTTSWTPVRSTRDANAGTPWVDDNFTPYSYDDGVKYYYTSNSAESDIMYESLTACINNNYLAEDCAHYSVGNYYNWSAAVASNDTSGLVDSYKTMPDSICPAGWSLPVNTHINDGYSDFDYLLKNAGITVGYGGVDIDAGYSGDGFNNMRLQNLWLVRSGRIVGSSIGALDGTSYWSSSSYGNTGAFRLYIKTDEIYPENENNRYVGISIRCIARNTMQNSTTANIVAYTDHAIGETTKLSDTRDGKTYTVSVIPDGRIWMTTNLDLAGGTTITSADSNVANNYTLPESSEEGFTDQSTAYVYNSGNTDSCGDEEPCYSYYSYVAATAGTNPSSGNAEYDICPKGWRLPTSKEYSVLLRMYPTGGDIAASSWQPVYNGDYGNDVLRLGGYRGNFWSSTATSAVYANMFFFYSNSSYASDIESSYDKSRGDGIRCVQKASVSGIDDMQDFAGLNASERQAKLDSMKTNIQYEMEDVRDGKTYTVAKLPNGSLWMTQNLDIAGGATLTPATSNVANDYTLPVSSTAGFDNENTAFVYNSDSINCGNDSPCYSYYSFAAATAGTNPSPATGEASYDICPKGWRLPSYADHTSAVDPTPDSLEGILMNTLSGRYAQNQLEYGGEYGYYWLSTTSSNNTVRRIIASSGGIYSDTDYRNRGNSIRCILDNTTISNLVSMQDFDSLTSLQRGNVISSMVEDQQYTLKDSRDNKSYTIAKLSDGTIWMTKNLDLAGGTALYSDTSNVPSGYPTSGGTPYYTLPASDINGFSNAAVASVYNSNSTTCGDNSPCYSYYNYAAATANTNPSANDAMYDICPKGWRLPVKTEYDSIVAMYNTGSIITTSAWQGVYSGNIQGGGVSSGGVAGYYQSSTADTSGLAWAIVYGESVNVNRTYNKIYGFAVRCILNTTLQDTTVDMLGDLIPDAGDTVVLSDKRDGEKYTIGRLADGNVWMLENLRLGDASTMVLTTYDTNIKANWTLPASISTGSNSFTTAQINIDSSNVAQSYGDGEGKIGVYYNFCAASAGTICTTAANDTLQNTAEDVCPKGWRLPTGGTNGEFVALFEGYSSNSQTIKSVLRLSNWGAFNGGTVTGRGDYGDLWTSTAKESGIVWRMSSDNDVYNPTGAAYRSIGIPIRCVKSH